MSVSILQSGIHEDDLALKERAPSCMVRLAMAEPVELLPLLQLEFRKRIHGDEAERVLMERASFWASMAIAMV